jgi:hypothetical protein
MWLVWVGVRHTKVWERWSATKATEGLKDVRRSLGYQDFFFLLAVTGPSARNGDSAAPASLEGDEAAKKEKKMKGSEEG